MTSNEIETNAPSINQSDIFSTNCISESIVHPSDKNHELHTNGSLEISSAPRATINVTANSTSNSVSSEPSSTVLVGESNLTAETCIIANSTNNNRNDVIQEISLKQNNSQNINDDKNAHISQQLVINGSHDKISAFSVDVS